MTLPPVSRAEYDAALKENERLRVALVEVAGWFIPGQRNTYLPGSQVLDRIRVTVEAALAPLGGDEGTPA